MHKVIIDDDFDLGKIAQSGQCFRAGRVSSADAGAGTVSNNAAVYRFIAADEVLYIRQIRALFKDDAIGAGEYEISCSPDKWHTFWANYFDLERNYRKIRKSAAENARAALTRDAASFIKRAINFSAGLRVLKQNSWETLVTFIISQRKNMRAIASAVEALCSRFGKPIEVSSGANDDEKLFAFPTPDAICKATDAELKACGLGYRAPYVRCAAEMVNGGDLQLEGLRELPDEALLEELQRVHGVGKKVANCVCLFGFGRTSAIPIDVWIGRAIDEECAGCDPFLAFGKNAGIVQQYVFYYMTHRK